MGRKRKKPSFFRLTFFLILVVILLWLLIGMNGIEKIALTILPGLIEKREARIDLQSEKAEFVENINSLREDNINLSTELAILEDTLNAYMDQQAMDEYWSANPGIDGVFAKVILRDPYNLYTSFVIDKGSSDGLSIGLPVLGKREIIGRIIDIQPDFSRVRLITSPKLSFGAYVKRTNDLGVLTGGKKELTLTYLTFNSDVALGDDIVTSGTTDITPGGLPLGKVSEVVRKNPEEELIVKVKQEEDIGKLMNVYVVTSVRQIPPEMTLKDDQP